MQQWQRLQDDRVQQWLGSRGQGAVASHPGEGGSKSDPGPREIVVE